MTISIATPCGFQGRNTNSIRGLPERQATGIWANLSFEQVKKLQRIEPITREEAQEIVRFEYDEKIKNGEGDMVHKTIQDALIGERYLGRASNGQVYAVRPEVHIPGTGELMVTMGVYYEGIPQPFALYKETFPLR